MSTDQEKGESRRISRMVIVGSLIVAVAFVVVTIWPILTRNPVGTPKGGANPATAADTTASRDMPAQRAAESTVGKNNPAGLADQSGGRAAEIKQSSQPLSLSDQARSQIKDVIAKQDAPRVQQANFEMMIGAAVPGQVKLQDLPPAITEIMNGFWGDQYVLVQDKLVIVDQHARRVVAIVPGVA